MNIYRQLAEFTVIETSRLLLRPHQFTDVCDMFEYSGNPQNLKYIFLTHLSLEEAEFSIANNFMRSPLGKWAIELKSEEKMIGTIHFIKISEKTASAEIGYVLNKSYWKMGLMTEALSVLTEFAFEQFGLKKLELMIDKENIASQKLALRVGYQEVRSFKAANQYTGIIRNFEKYELNKSEFYRQLTNL
ncbi:MAG: GNAT family N-acetyltransferase [Streptococcaceae bacterium]|nr:GNAT family N-acetyltransferase [Streptococcaceae bacterium]